MNQWVSPSVDTDSRWQAELHLGLTQTPRGTVLKECRHLGPLYVQKPFYPEGRELAHIYLLHPPGGMVSGDDLQISVTTNPEAQCLVTTPGAGRVYRARPDRTLQKQKISLCLEANSTLEWLPLETIIFPDACTDLSTDIHLAENSSVIAWEVTCFGLTASEEPFKTGDVSQCLQVFREGRLKLRERLQLNPEKDRFMQARAGLNNCSVNGLMLAGPFDQPEETEELMTQLRGSCEEIDALAAVTLNDEFIQVRYLGDCSEQARNLFTQCWKLIRPQLLNREGCEPRIWAT
ncbi:MAG: urease accessory protein UreD [Neptuniibacter sp.]